ncbi:hypothetical protein FDECE_12005 [Fusarium decemcellulare]|nr:hypothetical protein FDECE_12005 [Fusarium decemcellulare]
MDLRSVLNTSDSGDRGPPKAPPKQQQPPPHLQHHPQPHPQQQQPHRPPQSPAGAPPPQFYRDYARQPPPQPSPGKPAPQEYPPHAAHPHHPHQQHPQHQQPQSRPPSHPLQSPRQQPPAGVYPPASPYQTPGPYPGRPAPPPLQPAGSFHDVRSPSGPAPAQSPYRTSTTPSAASAAAGYPFPPTQSPAEIASPVQRHQYPPAQYASRESFSQGPPGGPQHHPSGPYASTQQQQHAVPHTPPVGSSGPQPYIHQRSQSTHSTPTPTSAHSQHPYGPPYAQGSPVAASRPPPGEYNRQPSQPATPIGPPLSAGSRQPSLVGSFAQPPSPYQQRLSSAAGAPVAQAHAQAQAHVQSSPPPPPPPVKRISSSYGSPAPDMHRRSQSRSERAPSASVSPKTRVPSLQSNPDPLAAFAADAKAKQVQQVQQTQQASVPQPMAIDSGRATTPAKRKLEDRDLSPKAEPQEKRPRPSEVNGSHAPQAREHPSSSPVLPTRKKRIRRSEPPIWAQDVRVLGNKMPDPANFVLQKRVHSHINGKPEANNRSSRHTSPESTRANPTQSAPPVEPGPQDILGAWEPSILGVKPYEEISRRVADFLFLNVISVPDMQEITSRGIQFEIEAKLGTLIDKDTNHRVDRFLDSECVLHDNQRVAFRSSMTEGQHKYFNDFLNETVKQTHPRAPNGGNRVQVHYKHRREVDRFFELPPELQARIPGCMRSRLGSRMKSVRARVTYDQKTREVLGKIIKARVADIDIHMPQCPMDCRISINLEMNWDGPVEELEQLANHGDRQPDRNKDRLSYTHGHYQIDLTQVTHAGSGPGGAQRMEKEHELEIELNPSILVDQGRKASSGQPHRYQELIEGFVDNVRVLARKARDLH